MRRLAALIALVVGLGACNNDSGAIFTITTTAPVTTATTAPPTTQATTTTLSITTTTLPPSRFPLLEVPIQSIHLADDDGANAAEITLEQIEGYVAEANRIYATAGIRFTFDPNTDSATLRDTALNNFVTGAPHNVVLAARALAETYPGKLVVLNRGGVGGAFSSATLDVVVMPGGLPNVCGEADRPNIALLAHEIGHYLSLGHTYGPEFDSIAEAEAFLTANGGDPAVFDGDGFDDTPPHPFVNTGHFRCEPVESVTLSGRELPIPSDNVMAQLYGQLTGDLTDEQIARVRLWTELRMLNGMLMPSNSDAVALELEDAPVAASPQCGRPGRQDMTGFGTFWAEADQLFVPGAVGCVLEFSFEVAAADFYDPTLYATRAPDFGVIQVWFDGTSMFEPIDLYAPAVLATGPIRFPVGHLDAGTHTMRIEVVDVNEASTGAFVGLDVLDLPLAG